MENQNYIIAHCEISGNAVFKNGEQIFERVSINPQDFLLSVYDHFNLSYPRFHKMDNMSKLGWLASEVLLSGENVIKDINPQDVGIVLSNANSCLDTDIRYLQSADRFASPALFVYTLPNIVAGEICIRNNFKGENAFFISESFDAGLMDQYVTCLLGANSVRVCICGWVEFLKDHYKSVLFLAGRKDGSGGRLFTSENLDNIFSKQEV